MNPTLTAGLAREHVADLRRMRREAGGRTRRRGRANAPANPAGAGDAVVLRLADAQDRHTLRRLAELDEAVEPKGDVLLALVDGEAVAALSLDDGHVVSNPFVATSAAIALLRLRAQHLAGPVRRRRRPRLRPRFA
jgi:hypothetical protein